MYVVLRLIRYDKEGFLAGKNLVLVFGREKPCNIFWAGKTSFLSLGGKNLVLDFGREKPHASLLAGKVSCTSFGGKDLKPIFRREKSRTR